MSAWWLWAGAALGLLVMELVVPGHVFMGFAVGVGAVAVLLALGGPPAAFLAGAPALALLVAAVLSGLAVLALRRWFGRRDEVRIFKRDINED